MNDQVETQEAEAVEAAPAKPKNEKRNDVTKPGEGTQTRRVWDTATEISNEKGRAALSQEVHAALEGVIEKATISTQYNRWCKFYGVTREQRQAARESLKPAKPAAPEVESEEAAE